MDIALIGRSPDAEAVTACYTRTIKESVDYDWRVRIQALANPEFAEAGEFLSAVQTRVDSKSASGKAILIEGTRRAEV
jgi:hypothetical protein